MKSPLWKHAEQFYQGREFGLKVKVIDRCFGRSSKRMIAEASANRGVGRRRGDEQ